MTHELSDHDRETLAMLSRLPTLLGDKSVVEVVNRVRAVMVARDNAQAAIGRVRVWADDYFGPKGNNSERAELGIDAALDGSGVTE